MRGRRKSSSIGRRAPLTPDRIEAVARDVNTIRVDPGTDSVGPFASLLLSGTRLKGARPMADRLGPFPLEKWPVALDLANAAARAQIAETKRKRRAYITEAMASGYDHDARAKAYIRRTAARKYPLPGRDELVTRYLLVRFGWKRRPSLRALSAARLRLRGRDGWRAWLTRYIESVTSRA